MNAANLFAYQKFVFDVIYIDASHEYKNVRQDLEAWWPLLRPGGVMFGDDYIVGCPGVIRAACEWAEHVKGNLMLAAGGKWVLQKI